MDNTILEQLIQKAKNDVSFFHELVFNTTEALKQFNDVELTSQLHLTQITPEKVINILTNSISACDGNVTCSCTSGTCGGTCGGSTCDVTCSGGSCGRTCDNSCGYTTNMINDMFELPEIKIYRFRGYK